MSASPSMSQPWVWSYGIFAKQDKYLTEKLKQVTAVTLLSTSQVLSIHTPITPINDNLMCSPITIVANHTNYANPIWHRTSFPEHATSPAIII